MGDRTRRSAIFDSSDLSSDDDFPSTNNMAESTSSWFPSHATLEILQAHLEADADSDSSEDAGPRVHPDFFVHLERLRRINEANRVNARREVEAWYETAFGSNQSQHQASHIANSHPHASDLPDESQHEAARMLEESHRENSQFNNELNQPSDPAGAEHRLQPPAMGVRDQHETQDFPAAGPFEPMPHILFEASGYMGPAHPRENSQQHRPPSPYPTAAWGQSSTVPAPVETLPMSAPQPQRYTDWGNPYRFPFDPAPFPEGATPYAPERILQAWLIRQQLIAGVSPEDIQPMAVPRGRRHRTPPYIVLNDSGAHIIRIEPATFEGAMLPLPALPWLPRRANLNASTTPVSSNAPDASVLPTAPNTVTAPDPVVAPSLAGTQYLSEPREFSAALTPTAAPTLSAATNSPAATVLLTALTPPAPPKAPADPSSAAPRLSFAPNLSAANSSPLSHLQAAATLLDALTPPVAPALPGSTVVLDPTSVPERISEDSSQHVAESQNPDPPSVPDAHPETPSTSESGFNENSQTSVIALQPHSQASVPLAVQNRTDAGLISSQETHSPGVSFAHSHDRESLAISPLSNEGTETRNIPARQAPNGNGIVHHAVTFSEPEDPEEPATPRLCRFAIDGADESLGVGRLSGKVKAIGDQSSSGGLI